MICSSVNHVFSFTECFRRQIRNVRKVNSRFMATYSCGQGI